MYNSENGVAYITGCNFNYNKAPEGYTPTGTGSAYFGYGSTTYINNSTFTKDDDDTGDIALTIKQGSGTIPTTVYISNSTMTGLRCDAGQVVYLGAGIDDSIKQTAISGTKHLTNFVYVTVNGEAYAMLPVDTKDNG